MAFSNGYTFGFAAVVCIVCSTALASVSLGLKPMQEANARRDLQKNILQALDLPGDGKTVNGKEVDALWKEKVEVRAIDPKTGQTLDVAKADLNKNGEIDNEDLEMAREQDEGGEPTVLGLFIRKDNGTVAVPMYGKGLWGPISAYIAFDPQVTTVKGTTFFAPKETPGLGAEIMNTPFESAWIGKSIVEGGKTTAIAVRKAPECDEVNNPHCVDGVSGATITSRGVDVMVADSLKLYEPYFKTVR